MQQFQEKFEALLSTTDLINKKFEILGASIGDQLMLFELYTSTLVSDPMELRRLIDQYARNVDDKLNIYKRKIITDLLDLNYQLFTDMDNYRK